MKKKISLLLVICLLWSLLIGCADRIADFDLFQKGSEYESGSMLEQFAEAEHWNDQVTVTAEDGKEILLTINADIVLPDTDAMAVVEVEETVVDSEYKQKILSGFFEGSEIYYHDPVHCTREELEDMIAGKQDDISDMQRYMTVSHTGVTEEEWETSVRYWEAMIDSAEKVIEEYEGYLETAKDTYTLAEDYDGCNEFAGYRDGSLYVVVFTPRNQERQTVSSIEITPVDERNAGPESLRGHDQVMRGDTDGCRSDELTNTCSLSREDARAVADRFVERIGMADQICYQENDALWQGVDWEENAEGDDGWFVVNEQAFYGYEFVYGTGVDGVVFAAFGDLMDYNSVSIEDYPEAWYHSDDQIRIVVTDAGIIEVRMDYPVTVGRVTSKVGLLPLEDVQNILKSELAENGSQYDFMRTSYFTRMDLGYFRLKDDSQEGCYSYVPVWYLYTKIEGGGYDHAVFVNAIDGSVIYQENEVGGQEYEKKI